MSSFFRRQHGQRLGICVESDASAQGADDAICWFGCKVDAGVPIIKTSLDGDSTVGDHDEPGGVPGRVGYFRVRQPLLNEVEDVSEEEPGF